MSEVSQSVEVIQEELERLRRRVEELEDEARSRALDLAKREEWERFQEAILETTGALISVLDTDHKFIFWSRGAEALTGYDRSEVLGGKGVLQTIYPDESYRQKVADFRNKVIAGEAMDDLQLDVVTKDGRPIGTDQWKAAGERVAALVVQTLRPILLAGADAPQPWASGLGVPIEWRGNFLGVLTLLANSEGHFEERHFETAQMFSTQAAVAIANARLYEEVHSLATSDELTGVLNRRALLSMGPREFERARRMQRPLTILFVDLDGLKGINDSFSHEVGDRILQEVTQRIRKSIRAVDVLARIGGDEFVVMLVETSIDGATDVAERLRQAVEAIRISTDRGLAGVTVSIGLAGASPAVDNLEALIRRADQAMYAAKQGGRNRIIVLES